jgi:hypothetical protein
MGFEMAGQWTQHRDSITQLDVRVPGSFPEGLFYVRTLLGFQEIMSGNRMIIGVVTYKGAPLMLRLHRTD